MLDPKAMFERPIAARHRIIFYLGHFEAFDWNLLARSTLGLDPFNESFDDLFAFGIDPVDGHLPNDIPSEWPDVLKSIHIDNASEKRWTTSSRRLISRHPKISKTASFSTLLWNIA